MINQNPDLSSFLTLFTDQFGLLGISLQHSASLTYCFAKSGNQCQFSSIHSRVTNGKDL
jgi:hypothetical protein